MVDETDSDLESFGAPAEIIEKIRAEKQTGFEVFEDNWPAVEIFIRASTQWNVAGMGGYVGLNYQSIEFLFKLFEVEDQKAVFDDIRVIEMAALRVLNEAAKGDK